MLFPRPLANFRSPEGLLNSFALIRAKIEPIYLTSVIAIRGGGTKL